jgi:hypothetical protein
MGDYDRIRALLDGNVQIDSVDPVCMTLRPEETFLRAFRGVEFDISDSLVSKVGGHRPGSFAAAHRLS